MKRSLLVPVLAVVFVGCGSGATDYSQQQFQSAQDLARVVANATGWTCSTSDQQDTTHTAASLSRYGFISVPCSDGSVTIVTSDAKRAELAANPGNAIRSGHCRLDGGNWSVWGSQYAVEAAEKSMGGTLTCA